MILHVHSILMVFVCFCYFDVELFHKTGKVVQSIPNLCGHSCTQHLWIGTRHLWQRRGLAVSAVVLLLLLTLAYFLLVPRLECSKHANKAMGRWLLVDCWVIVNSSILELLLFDLAIY